MIFLSVVIPTRNRADLLRDALLSLSRQTLGQNRFEVIVVDNGSTDHTSAVTKEFEQTLLNLRYIYEPIPGLHTGRHRGLRAARGDILVYADDDIRAFPQWLASISEAFADAAVDMVGGNNIPDFIGSPPDWLNRLWQMPRYGGRAIPHLSIIELPGGLRPISPYLVWGCNFSIRKSALMAAGGFHPDGMPRDRLQFRGDGETHVSRHVARSGRLCLFHPQASVYHKVTMERMTMDYFRSRGFSQGVSESYTTLRQRHGSQGDRLSLMRTTIHAMKNFASRGKERLRIGCLRDPAMERLRRETEAGYRAGFEFHQQAFANNPEVRAWVLKPNYLED